MGLDSYPSRVAPARWSTIRTPGTRSYGPTIVEQLDRAGVSLFDWQADWFDETLEVDELGRLTRTTATLIVGRRNGKTYAIACRALAGIVFLGELRWLYTAHNGDTANEVFSIMEELAELPAIRPLVSGVYRSNGKERITFHNGGRFQVRTRTEHGGRGRETDGLVIDEAMIGDDSHIAALTPLVAKAAARGRGQVIYASSAGDDNSLILLPLVERGRELDGQPGGEVAFREYAASRSDAVDDVEAWRAANPSLGTAILDERFLASQLSRMSPEAFRREHLGIWGTAAELPAIDPDAWASLATDQPVDVDPSTVVLSFDVDLDRANAVILALARDMAGRAIVRTLRRWHTETGEVSRDDVVAEVERLYDELGPSWIGYDRLGGTDVAVKLEAGNYPVKAFPATAIANACAVLSANVTAGQLAHDGDEALAVELGRMIPKPFADRTRGAWLPTRASVSAGSICGGMALTVGYAALLLATEDDSTIVAAS